jgi:hypothetical protein
MNQTTLYSVVKSFTTSPGPTYLFYTAYLQLSIISPHHIKLYRHNAAGYKTEGGSCPRAGCRDSQCLGVCWDEKFSSLDKKSSSIFKERKEKPLKKKPCFSRTQISRSKASEAWTRYAIG